LVRILSTFWFGLFRVFPLVHRLFFWLPYRVGKPDFWSPSLYLPNSQILENSEGKPYLVSDNRYKMLSLYENDYKNSILQNTYLILGNLVEGSLDATRFGFVDKGDILGKVVY